MNLSVFKIFMKMVLRFLFSPLIKVVNRNNEKIWQGIERLNVISNLHQKTFKDYKGIYTGKDVVVIGAGPSVNKFKPIPNCIYVGLNSACKLKNVRFDYLFSIDKFGIDKIYSDFSSVNCIKFIGDQNLGPKYQIPESVIFNMGDIKRYMTDAGLYGGSKCALHIESQPLGNYNSVALQAMQFVLYTNPRRVYLVGIDCSALGHFHEDQGSVDELKHRVKERKENLDRWAKETLKAWKDIKDFANVYYPDTEIISINPVGLKGFFKDVYQ